MKFISRLMPQEKRFYAFFNDHVELIKQGGVAVVRLLASHSDSLERSKQIERIQDLEHRADRITHDCVALLHTTFITPFDRDVVHRLISRLDDILDLTQDTAESFALYDIQKLTPVYMCQSWLTHALPCSKMCVKPPQPPAAIS